MGGETGEPQIHNCDARLSEWPRPLKKASPSFSKWSPICVSVRFAGIDTELAVIREVQALRTMRFATLEQKLTQLAAATAEMLWRLTEQS